MNGIDAWRPSALALSGLLLATWGAAGCMTDDSRVLVPAGGAAQVWTDADGGAENEAKLAALGKSHLLGAACSRGPQTCPGAALPKFKAPDFQPKHSLGGTEHGLEVFKGKIIIVAMLAGW